MANLPRLRRAIVAGGTGFTGRAICAALRARGITPVCITRNNPPPTDHAPITWQQLNFASPWPVGWDVEAVINVAGAPAISPRPWTDQYVKELEESRISTNRVLVAAISRLPVNKRPKVFITASGVHYYGSSPHETYDESSINFNPEENYWTSLTAQWEAAAAPAEDLGVRVVAMRTGVVLGRGGGVFQQMRNPIRFGLGAALGDGKQFFPWIHETDLASLYMHAMTNAEVKGPLNAVAPQIIDNNKFTQTYAAAYKKSAPFHVPASIFSSLLGKERAIMLTTGNKVVPKKALDTGFQFKFPTIESAIQELVQGTSRPDQNLWLVRPGASSP